MRQPKLNEIKIDMNGTKEVRKLAKAKKIKITITLDADIFKDLRQLAESQDMQSRLEKLEKDVALLKRKISA